MKQRTNQEKQRRNQIHRISALRSRRELRLNLGFQRHEDLWKVGKKLPTDFEPYGKRKREGMKWQDCSCGCRWFHILAGTRGQDWGVCANPKSPRAGLLTFEHMGCPQYKWDKRSGYLDTPQGRRAFKRFRKAERERQQAIDEQRVVTVRLRKKKKQ
jgi:hypothetical protein